MEKSTLIKIVFIGGAAYLLYRWLKSSGYWDQWFGGASSNTFDASDPNLRAKVLTYCQSNPGGTATLKNGAQVMTMPCSQLAQALKAQAAAAGGGLNVAPSTSGAPGATSTTPPPNPQPPTPAPTSVTPPPAIDTTLATTLTQAMMQQVGRERATVSEWNWVWQHTGRQGIVENSQYGLYDQIDAPSYLQTRQAAGLSGLVPAVIHQFPPHLRWSN